MKHSEFAREVNNKDGGGDIVTCVSTERIIICYKVNFYLKGVSEMSKPNNCL